MRRFSSIATAVAALATGCTMAPTYERPAQPVPADYRTDGVYGAQPVAAPGARSADGVAADIGWRNFFVDARLQRLIGIALANSRDLLVAVLNVQAAQAQYRIVRSELLPTIGAQAGQAKQRTPRDLSLFNQTISNQYNVGLNGGWEIDLFGRVQSLKDQALAQYFATAYARKAAEISLVSQVATQYLQVLEADDLLKVTFETLRTAQDSYNLNKLKFEHGTASELDLTQSQTIVETAAANLQAQQRSRAQAVNALVLLLGEPMPVELPSGAPLNGQDLLTDIPAGLPSDLLTRRPDVMEAEQNLLAANANIGAARAAFFPSISLTGSFGTLSPTLGGLFKPGSAAWSFAPTHGASRRPSRCRSFRVGRTWPTSISRTSRRTSRLRSTRRRRFSRHSVKWRMASRRAAPTISRSRRSNATPAHSSGGSICRHCGIGRASTAGVLEAQQDLYATQQTLISARTQRLTNLVSLYRALGGGWIERTRDRPRAADAG